MTLKQVEPVECGEMRAITMLPDELISIRGKWSSVVIDEPEARALLEFLRKVCE